MQKFTPPKPRRVHQFIFRHHDIILPDLPGVRKFSATDICNILGYVNPNKIINRYCDSTPEYVRLATTGGPQNCRMIEAKDIRDILSHSRRKIVRRLRRWLDIS